MNRKGMIALMDAVIFVTLITFVSLALLDFDDGDEGFEEMDASDICELLLSIDMGDSGLIPGMGDSGYDMADAAAYATVNGTDAIFDEIRSMMDELTMGNYDYGLRFTCNGHVKNIGEINGFSGSSYSGTWSVTGGKDLFVEMWLY